MKTRNLKMRHKKVSAELIGLLDGHVKLFCYRPKLQVLNYDSSDEIVNVDKFVSYAIDFDTPAGTQKAVKIDNGQNVVIFNIQDSSDVYMVVNKYATGKDEYAVNTLGKLIKLTPELRKQLISENKLSNYTISIAEYEEQEKKKEAEAKQKETEAKQKETEIKIKQLQEENNRLYDLNSKLSSKLKEANSKIRELKKLKQEQNNQVENIDKNSNYIRTDLVFLKKLIEVMSIKDEITLNYNELKTLHYKNIKMLDSNLNCTEYTSLIQIDENDKTYMFIGTTDEVNEVTKLMKVWQTGNLEGFSVIGVYNNYRAWRDSKYR